MDFLPAAQLLPLWFFAFLAGFIDAIAGGGGLIQLPAIMTFVSGVPIVNLLATNKLSSIFGTAMSTYQYARKGLIPWRKMLPLALLAGCSSAVGGFAAMHVPNEFLKPLVIITLGLVLVYTLLNKNMGTAEDSESRFSLSQQRILAIFFGIVIGFYDGFFGPGVGSFFIMVFINVLGMNFLHASASAKICNLATNLGALSLFLFSGIVDIALGATMALFNIAGAFVGSRLAIQKGSQFVRVLFLIVTAGLFIKQIIDIL